MNKKTLVPILLVLPVLAIGYAIYRSTTEIITVVQNDRQVIYGEPQHGLTLGLCIFAGLCIIAAVMLLRDGWVTPPTDEHYPATKPGSKVASNYPH